MVWRENKITDNLGVSVRLSSERVPGMGLKNSGEAS